VARRRAEHRSGCPINLSLEVLGDTWSLLIVRDLMFGDAAHYRELLRSEEGIAPNILADRLRKLVALGILSSSGDPTHKQKTRYRLTEMGIALVPVLVQLGAWGRKFLPASDPFSIRISVLEAGGPAMWAQFMDELREEHLDAAPVRPRTTPTVRERLQGAYDATTMGSNSCGQPDRKPRQSSRVRRARATGQDPDEPAEGTSPESHHT
jgi:DNA-binding HxlR family transcriptional regulator